MRVELKKTISLERFNEIMEDTESLEVSLLGELGGMYMDKSKISLSFLHTDMIKEQVTIEGVYCDKKFDVGY